MDSKGYVTELSLIDGNMPNWLREYSARVAGKQLFVGADQSFPCF